MIDITQDYDPLEIHGKDQQLFVKTRVSIEMEQQHLGRYRATHGYKGVNDTELSFPKDQEFLLINKDNEEWWYVQLAVDSATTDVDEGYVPASYLSPVSPKYPQNATLQDADSSAADAVIPELVVESKENESEEDSSLVDSDGESEDGKADQSHAVGSYDESIVICYATSTHAYSKSNDGELGFLKGDRVSLLKEQGEWWFVRDEKGNVGWVPGSYFVKEGVAVSPSVITRIDPATPVLGTQSPPTVIQEIVAEKPPIPAMVKSSSQSSVHRNSTSNTAAPVQQQQEPIKYITKSLESIPAAEEVKQENSDSSSGEEEEEDDEEDDDEEEESDEEESEEESSESEEEEEEEDQDQGDVSDDVKHVLSTLKKRKSLRTKLRHLPLSELGKDITSTSPNDKLPIGFRPSALSVIEKSAEVYLLPELKRHGLGFRDLSLNAKGQTVRKRKVDCQFGVSLREAVNMANSAPLDVVGRVVRVCVWDREAVLSNVHSVAGWRELNTWKFREKSSSVFGQSMGGDGDFFVRVGGGGEPDGTLALLFELVLVVKDETDGRLRNVSCGWSVLSLYRVDGEIVEAGGYEIPVHGGRPGEMDVELAPPVALAGSNSARGLFSSKSSSGGCRLKVAVWKLSKTVAETANDLPDIFLGSMVSLPVLAFYRRVLANSLIGSQSESRDAVSGSKYEPILAIVPKLVNHNDLMSHLATGWTKRLKGMSRRDKRSYTSMKNHFTTVLMSIWPLLFIDMPTLIPGNSNNGVLRSEIWEKIQREGIVSFLSKPSLSVKEFGVEELEYDYLKTFRYLYPRNSPASIHPVVRNESIPASGRVTPLPSSAVV